MALAGFLSALRELILERGLPAGGPDQRRRALARRFPNLSVAEIGDLAAIGPDRLRVYTDLVFAGQREMLRWVYPMSTAAIVGAARRRGDLRPEGDVLFELVRRLHDFRPWRSASTRELAAGFQEYVAARRAELSAACPGLADLIEFERAELEVFYAADAPAAPIAVEALADLTVAELMARPVLMPAYVQPRTFAFDVLAVAAEWREHQALPEGGPDPIECRAVCGRHPQTLMPVWTRLSTAGFAALAGLSPGEPAIVEKVAAGFLAASGGGAEVSEQAMFAEFAAMFAGWAAAGVLLAPH